MKSLQCFSGLKEFGDLFIISNPQIVTLNGLHCLLNVDGDWGIFNDSALDDMSSLDSSLKVDQSLSISSNSAPIELMGFKYSRV